MSEHLARHALERLVANDPRDAIAPELRAHLASCEHCTQRFRGIVRARDEYAATRSAARFAADVATRAALREPARSRWQRLRVPAAAMLAIAAAALIAFATTHVHEDRIVYKGPLTQLQFYVKHGEQTRLVVSGDALAAGDQLAFTYSVTQPQHLLLFGIDDAGTITRYFPEPTLAPDAVLPAGVARQLPVGIELDARRGQERLIALFSATPLDEARARDALSAALREARARGGGIADVHDLAVPAAQVSVWFKKP